MPQYERLFAIPTGVALIGLGYSLWRQQRAPAARPVPSPVSSQLEPAGCPVSVNAAVRPTRPPEHTPGRSIRPRYAARHGAAQKGVVPLDAASARAS